MQYIKAQDIINEVINEMPAYFETNKVDETILYPVLHKCLDKMGSGIKKEASDVLCLSNGRAKLPDDFDTLCIAISCIGKTLTRQVPNTGTMRQEVKIYEVDECDTYRVYVDDCDNMYKIVQQFPVESWHWNDYELLSVNTQGRPHCDLKCPNFMSNSSNEITINNGYIQANFPDGDIYIEYLSNLKTAEGIDVPKNATVKEWIKTEMKLRVLEILYLNGEGDLTQRIGLLQNKAFVHMEEARAVWKRSEMQDFYGLRNSLARRYTSRAYPMLYGTSCRYPYR